MKLSNYKLAILALIITNVIWGASIPIFKWSLQEVPPFTFAFMRFFISAIILLPFTIHSLKISRQDFVSLFVLSFLGFFLHIGILLYGLSISSSVNASVIATAAPIFLLIGSAILFKEKIKSRTIVGTAISLIGVTAIILRPIFDHGLDGTILGNSLFVLSTISFVGYTFILKNYVTHLRAVTVTFYLFAFATLTFLPFYLVEATQKNILFALSGQAFIGILFGAVFTSVIGYILYNFAIRKVKASETGIFLYIDPFITVLIAVPLLHENITFTFVIGALLVFIGIFIAEKRLQYHPLKQLFHKE